MIRSEKDKGTDVVLLFALAQKPHRPNATLEQIHVE